MLPEFPRPDWATHIRMDLLMKLFQICTVAAMAAAGAANAGVVYNNPIQLTNANGDCSFSTTCAASGTTVRSDCPCRHGSGTTVVELNPSL